MIKLVKGRKGYLKDEVGVEPNVMNRRDETAEKSGPQVDEGIGGEETCGDRGFPWEPVVLIHCVNPQQHQHSP